ncbi:MAG: peptide-methionine (S)-S-oxide reductase [Candidatus Marinimicrobia bacterium]|nr:peptide-methionine (S)-S-oxide reductase [Candidatus Neomarinimicrobiota bacterium]|tara:strand:- start:15 stop:530 length:516 start_codon:yes stop_codon:yes gene_type:complete
MNIAVFGAGCFWCVEAIFSQLAGVASVVSGYTGGATENPTYDSICTGTTGHAEVCKITYDAKIISYERLLEVLFLTHDPTTLNQQGADKGTQYRSAIFYIDENQKKMAENYISKLKKNKTFKDQIVTEITKLDKFYEAENYHQDYYKNNTNAPYCKIVIKPKLDKFLKNNY